MKSIIIFLFLLIIYSCGDSERRDRIEEELIEEGVAKYIKQRNQKCKQEAYLEADRLVDSMMLYKAFYSKIDTFIKPAKPQKPYMPPIKDAKDNTPIGPVLKNGNVE